MGNNNWEVKCNPEDAYVLTEQEWKKSCDVVHMLKIAAQGGEIRMNQDLQYGEDQHFGSRMEMLLAKQKAERDLEAFAKEEGLDLIETKKNPIKTVSDHLRKKHEAKKASLPKQEASDKSTSEDVQTLNSKEAKQNVNEETNLNEKT